MAFDLNKNDGPTKSKFDLSKSDALVSLIIHFFHFFEENEISRKLSNSFLRLCCLKIDIKDLVSQTPNSGATND